MFMRQEESPPVTYSVPVDSILRDLSDTMAAEVSAFFSAKVPPKPQHSSLLGSSNSSMPSTLRSSR